MFILKTLSAVAVMTISCVARPTSSSDFNTTVVEKLNSAPFGWEKDASAKLDKDATSITLKIHLVNQDMDKFHDLAMNVREQQ
jgi:tripeptidyl-peptidase-1